MVTFTLKDIMPAEMDQQVTIHINQDNDKLFEVIKEFVDKYNELVEKIEEN